MLLEDKDSMIFNSRYNAKIKEIQNNMMIEHLNKEREILLDAIAAKDISLQKKMAEMEERMIMMQYRFQNNNNKQQCTIM